MAESLSVGGIVVIRPPHRDPELPLGHKEGLRVDAKFQLAVLAEPEPPRFSYLYGVEGDFVPVHAPDAFGDGVAVEDALVHPAGDRIPIQRHELPTQKVGGFPVSAVLTAWHNLPLGSDKRVLTLPKQAVDLIVAQKFRVILELPAERREHRVRV